jgi:SAM-dependent methyltransferase
VGEVKGEVDEREHHDLFFACDAERIVSSPLIRVLHQRIAKDFICRAQLHTPSRVLSLGCGDGTIETLLAGSVGEVVGYDVSPVAIAQARARARNAGLANVSFEVADLCEPLRAPIESFDAVCGFAFLHHLPADGIKNALQLAWRALRPEGVFYSVDPSARRLVRHLSRLVKRSYDRYHSPDERELESEALASLCAQVGFRAPDLWPTDFFVGPLGWLAPGLPEPLARPLDLVDRMLSSLPLLSRLCSSFALMAVKSEPAPRAIQLSLTDVLAGGLSPASSGASH